MVATRDDNHIRALQRPARLSQTPSWQQIPPAKRHARVDQNDVHIARKFQMLKAIVENEPFDSAICQRNSVFVTIRANSKRHTVRQAGFQKLHFVASRNNLRLASRSRSRCSLDRFSSIPARKNSHTFAFRKQK